MGFIARFFLLVLFLSFGELYLLILVAGEISVFTTLLLCVFTGVLGGALVRHQGLSTLKNIQQSMGQARVPGVDIVSGLILLVIGTLMLTPGFLTDTIAFLLLVPPLRKLAATVLLAYFKKRIKFQNVGLGGAFNQAPASKPTSEGVIIDVEPKENDRN